MNNRMARTVRDKAGQLARRALRARDKDLKKQRDTWIMISCLGWVSAIVLAVLIFLI